ncbi:MAG TPA: rhomboid family intramembrane serine protease, partial [Candidatus Binatia bacterium]|nr:rhomboid family intramembrane serine protease [Candidatus Binatia bacterium]
NHIFLFLAVISPLVVLARTWRPGAQHHGWRIAALVVLAITVIAWFLVPTAAGYIGGAAWIALLFLPAIGLRKMTELAAQADYKSAAKLGEILQILHPSAELRDQVRLLRHLESQGTSFEGGMVGTPLRNGSPAQIFRPAHRADRASEAGRMVRHSQLRSAPAVLALIVLNAVAFLFEISVGDLNDPEVLHRVGALEPYAVVVQGEYWRLFTALFLHGGFTHLLFNIFALYILGPPLERSIGTLRFTVSYLISGLASSAGVVGLTILGFVQVSQLVGASGCIMGIVGTWAGFLVRHRHVPQAKQRLGNIVMIIVIQVAFDLSTPQVSMAAHLCGLIAGFFLGLILAPRTVAGIGDRGAH